MKIIFAGTPDFAVPSLKTLIKYHTVQAVITQPDRPAGRGQKTKPSPVKEVALKYGLKLFDQPINQLADLIKKINPDLIVVVAYGGLLNSEILKIARLGVINIHSSLLPKYRGASPIQASILNGDTETGVTIMQMVKKLDAGPIISQKKIEINSDDTAGTLHDKLAELGADLLSKTLGIYPSGFYKLLAQDESQTTYTNKITTANAKLDITQPAEILARQIRAYNPWPGAWIEVQSAKLKINRLKIFKAKLGASSPTDNLEPGTLTIHQNLPALICKNKKILLLEEVQIAGKKRISGEEFIKGYLR